MKAFLLVLAIVAFVSVEAIFPEKTKEERLRYSAECKEESGVAESELQRLRDGDHTSRDANEMEFIYCLFRKTHIMNEDGSFNGELALEGVDEEEKPKVRMLIADCAEIVGKTKVEVAFHYFKCYHMNRPNQEIFF